jgi:hypothetical protein
MNSRGFFTKRVSPPYLTRETLSGAKATVVQKSKGYSTYHPPSSTIPVNSGLILCAESFPPEIGITPNQRCHQKEDRLHPFSFCVEKLGVTSIPKGAKIITSPRAMILTTSNSGISTPRIGVSSSFILI